MNNTTEQHAFSVYVVRITGENRWRGIFNQLADRLLLLGGVLFVVCSVTAAAAAAAPAAIVPR